MVQEAKISLSEEELAAQQEALDSLKNEAESLGPDRQLNIAAQKALSLIDLFGVEISNGLREHMQSSNMRVSFLTSNLLRYESPADLKDTLTTNASYLNGIYKDWRQAQLG